MSLDSDTKISLAAELEDVSMELANLCGLPIDDDASYDTLVRSVQSETERLNDIAELYDYKALQHITQWAHNNISLESDKQLFVEKNDQGLFFSWIELLAAALYESTPDLLAELEQSLLQSDWTTSIDPDELQHFLASLSGHPESNEAQEDASPSPAAPIENDNGKPPLSYKLAWDEDAHPELVEAFFIETPDQVIQIADLIRQISTGSADTATYQTAARVAHTIKGSSAVLGIEAVAKFSHTLEDILEYSIDHKLPKPVAELLVESADCLESMFDSLISNTPAPSQYLDLLQQLIHWEKQLASGYVDNEPEEEVEEVEATISTPPETGVLDNSNVQTVQQEKTTEKIQHQEAKEADDSNSYPLAWNKDVHPELLDAYMGETPEHVVEIAQLMRRICEENVKKKTYTKASRLAHTIKGTSAVVGITAVADYTHQLEDIFNYAAENPLPTTVHPLLLESADLLESLYDSLLSEGVPPEEYPETYERLCNWRDHLTLSDSLPENLTTESTVAPLQEDSVKFDITDTTILKDLKAKALTLGLNLPPLQQFTPPIAVAPAPVAAPTPAKRTNLNEASLRLPISTIENLLNLSTELITANTQISDQVEALIKERTHNNAHNERLRNMLDELEWAVNQQVTSGAQLPTSENNISELDSLELDSYNELHSITGLISEAIDDERERSLSLSRRINTLKGHTQNQRQINKALNNTVLSMRMEPVNILTPRLQRIVRETCRSTEKRAELKIIGDEMAIDTDIIKGLVDPLLHLLRNAVDHGIETPKQRNKLGKPDNGNIQLQFAQQGDQVILTLKDDGSGIDAEKVYRTAIKKGIISINDTLSNNDKLRLILHAGLSTRKNITEISGRGVGLDVVNAAIKNISGNIIISSTLNQGTEIRIQVPLTLSAANILLAEVEGNTIAIPNSSIKIVHYLAKNSIQRKKGKQYIEFQGQQTRLVPLSSLLGWPEPVLNTDQSQAVLIIEYQQKPYALYVDKILKPQEVTLKSLKPWMKSVSGVSGVCLLPNGVVAPVLNTFELLLSLNENMTSLHTTPSSQTSTNTTSKVLVVDDSLSNRKALSLMLDALDYAVETAIDGVDALQKIEKSNFSMVITDLEMPNMNGLELVESLRVSLDHKNIPIIMVTSRSTAKHRKLAEQAGVNGYLTKPVDNNTLKATLAHFITDTHLMQKAGK